MILYSTAESTAYFDRLKQALGKTKNDHQLFKTVANEPFKDKRITTLLGLGIIVLLLVNKKDRTIERIAYSETEMAHGALRMYIKPFKDTNVPLNYRGNLIAEAIRSGRYQQTSDWQYLFAPGSTPEEARLNQAGAGIGCSFVYPLVGVRDGGALNFSYYLTIDRVGPEHRNFMYSYSKLVGNILKAPKE